MVFNSNSGERPKAMHLTSRPRANAKFSAEPAGHPQFLSFALLGSSSILELDAEVRLTHYRLQRLGEQRLNLDDGQVETLKPAGDTGSGWSKTDGRKRLRGYGPYVF